MRLGLRRLVWLRLRGSIDLRLGSVDLGLVVQLPGGLTDRLGDDTLADCCFRLRWAFRRGWSRLIEGLL